MTIHGFLQRSGKLMLLIPLLAFGQEFSLSTSLPQEKWVKLGDRTVNYTVDHSEMVIEGIEADLGALRVKVKKGAINLHRCVAYYKNSQTAQIDILNSIPAGSESKLIELPSPVKTVIRLVFTYDTKNRPIQKAEVEIWGRLN